MRGDPVDCPHRDDFPCSTCERLARALAEVERLKAKARDLWLAKERHRARAEAWKRARVAR